MWFWGQVCGSLGQERFLGQARNLRYWQWSDRGRSSGSQQNQGQSGGSGSSGWGSQAWRGSQQNPQSGQSSGTGWGFRDGRIKEAKQSWSWWGRGRGRGGGQGSPVTNQVANLGDFMMNPTIFNTNLQAACSVLKYASVVLWPGRRMAISTFSCGVYTLTLRVHVII